jgi:hypothetical protein
MIVSASTRHALPGGSMDGSESMGRSIPNRVASRHPNAVVHLAVLLTSEDGFPLPASWAIGQPQFALALPGMKRPVG